MRFLKSHSEILMNRSGCPDYLWYACHEYICAVHESCANEHLHWETPIQKSGEGTPDISHIMQFRWYEPVLYYNPNASYPETKEEQGCFVGFGKYFGDALTFKILTTGKRPQVLHRSVVRSALDTKAQNKRVQFNKPLPVVEQRDQHKYPSKVIEVEEADPALRPKPKKSQLLLLMSWIGACKSLLPRVLERIIHLSLRYWQI